MRDHERELIAALVEGRLDDESEARALVASSPELREEYEAQMLAYRALTGAGTASLTEIERSSLRRDVWTAWRQQGAAASTKGSWYVRVAAVAAGLFVVVGLAAVLSTQGGADDDGFAEIAADTADRDLAGDDDAASDGAETFEDAADTTVAAASEPAAEALSLDYLAAEADRVRSGESSSRIQAFDADTDEDLARCLETAGLEGYTVIAVIFPPPEETGSQEEELRLYAAVPDEGQLADVPVAFVEPISCQLIHLDD